MSRAGALSRADSSASGVSRTGSGADSPDELTAELLEMAMIDRMEATRVHHELTNKGFAVCRQLIPVASVERAARKLEAAVDRHLAAAAASGELPSACDGLSFEAKIAQAYAGREERAPCSWVNQIKMTVAFQQDLFRDEALCALVEALTGRPAVVASRFNCRCKLRDSPGANFPWHQDHAFFRMQYLLKKQEPIRLLAAWAPLMPCNAANGAVEFCPVRPQHATSPPTHPCAVILSSFAPPLARQASHKLGFVRHGRSGGFLAAKQQPPLPEVLVGVVPSLEPGDVVLFTDLTLHRSQPNVTPQNARWSVDWAYELLATDAICPPTEPPQPSLLTPSGQLPNLSTAAAGSEPPAALSPHLEPRNVGTGAAESRSRRRLSRLQRLTKRWLRRPLPPLLRGLAAGTITVATLVAVGWWLGGQRRVPRRER